MKKNEFTQKSVIWPIDNNNNILLFLKTTYWIRVLIYYFFFLLVFGRSHDATHEVISRVCEHVYHTFTGPGWNVGTEFEFAKKMTCPKTLITRADTAMRTRDNGRWLVDFFFFSIFLVRLSPRHLFVFFSFSRYIDNNAHMCRAYDFLPERRPKSLEEK